MISTNYFYESFLRECFKQILQSYYMSNNNEVPPAWESILGLSWIILDEE